MEETYLGRQPIYNRKFEVHGFELLYRHADVDSAEFTDGDMATSRVILNTLTEAGLSNVVGDRLAFINVARNFIIDGGLSALPSSQVLFEIVGDIAVDRPLLNALRDLRQQGWRFVLDNYVDNEASRALLEVAQYVKIDTHVTSEAEMRRLVPVLRRHKVGLMAGCIENEAVLELCQSLAFDYFQGYHFSQPKLLKFKSVPTSQLTLLNLIGKLNDPHSTVKAIQSLIAQDVSLSYKILRHINSAYFNMPKRIDSIHRAVLLLGIDNIKAWATLIALANIDNHRSDLATTALVRAKMCELLADTQRLPQRESGFTVGLLSILDALTQAPLDKVLAALPLAEDINLALLRHEGPLGRILDCTLAYERGDWEAVDNTGLDPNAVSDSYFSALSNAYKATFALM